MHPHLEQLLVLQDRDLALDEVEKKLQTALDEVAAFDAEVEQAKEAVEKERRTLEAGIKRREEIEAKIEGLRILQDRRRQRLELAKTTRELQALGTELELARSVLAREESEWFKASEVTSEAEKRVEAAAQAVEELEAGQSERRTTLAEEVSAIEAECQAAREARQEASAALDRALLLRYDRLRQSRTTTVVVALRGSACGACYTAVPMSRRNQILTGAILDGCEACGVILYAADEVA